MKNIREETHSKIRVCEGTLHCEDRVIVIAARDDDVDVEENNAQVLPSAFPFTSCKDSGLQLVCLLASPQCGFMGHSQRIHVSGECQLEPLEIKHNRILRVSLSTFAWTGGSHEGARAFSGSRRRGCRACHKNACLSHPGRLHYWQVSTHFKSSFKM